MTDEELREVLAEEISKRNGPENYLAMLGNEWMEIDNELPPELSSALAAMRRIAAQVRADTVGWQPIETAPKDGTIFDVWLGGANVSDLDFYCDRGTMRSPSWQWWGNKFRPAGGLKMPIFVQPTHWIPLPDPPRALLNKDGG